MRRIQQVGLLLVLLFLSVSQAGAWEFSLSGVFTWEYYQFSQLGDKGFFGPFNEDNSSVGGQVRLAARNGWLGHEVASRTPVAFWGDDLASGSDVAANYMYTILFPKVKVNEAVSVRGVYRIGAWNPLSVGEVAYGQLNTSRYLNSQAPGIGNSFSPGYWQILNVEAQLPWGIITIGKQPNAIGLGLIIDSLENSTEAVVLSIPFGPFIIGAQYYFWGPGRAVGTNSPSNYPLKTDRSGAAQPHVAGLLMYNAGNISSETYIEYSNGHKGPESELYTGKENLKDLVPGLPSTYPVFAVDCSQFFGFTNFKYFDGRFFFNTEVGFYHEFYRQNGFALLYRGGRDPTPDEFPNTRYWELWAGMIECGAMAGPAKISFLWAYYPGPDRRGGRLIDRQPTIVPVFSPNGGVNMYLPYSLLLGYDYGSGNNSISRSSNHGFITDASTYGVRLDYAVAANLNVYGTFLYASRVSQGYGWGWIRPDPALSLNSPALQYANNGTSYNIPASGNLVDLSFCSIRAPNFSDSAPNILERDLGYEIGGGIGWNLIEGYTLTARAAYWKPGGWFKYACVDRRQPGWNVPNRDNRWGVKPNREIDPIFGVRVAIELAF
jgi:hypothetical protein